jgi:16S rRNA (cytidine1402-2'-O)-methyltransferase
VPAPRLPPRAPQASPAAEIGTLFVVATPIGHLEDITLRALRVLRDVALVAAEDTRRTGNLLRYYEITTPLLSVHEHNERQRIPQILEHLGSGRSIALVSDAGTPGVSDPGAFLVRAVRDAGFPIIPIPGPSTIATILSVSGIRDVPVSFLGFPPTRAKPRTSWLSRAQSLSDHAIVCFEAPHRLTRLFKELVLMAGDRPILVGREITKVHEEWLLGTPTELLARLDRPQGEFVLLILPASSADLPEDAPTDSEVRSVFGQLTDKEPWLSRREAVKAVAARLNLSPRAVYAAVERGKK